MYPAREKPVPGVSSEIIFNQMKLEEKVLAEKTEALEILKNDSNPIFLTMGAGDIDRMVKDIVKIVES